VVHVVVEFPRGSRNYELSFALRARILLDPFGIERTLAQNDDGRASHLGIFTELECLACLLMVPRESGVVQMRQVAVETHLQGQGLGRRLVAFSERWAREQGFSTIIAHARKPAVPFYEALNYKIHGPEFDEVGIPHLVVNKHLTLE
jgi:GNAT superfamily N-acetyltransferase